MKAELKVLDYLRFMKLFIYTIFHSSVFTIMMTKLIKFDKFKIIRKALNFKDQKNKQTKLVFYHQISKAVDEFVR